jgi:deoxycytidylate deaminase
MKTLSGNEESEAMKFIDEAAKVALHATCTRSKCGCVIVKDGKIIGQGFNSPALGLESQRRCENSKDLYNKKVTDKTCCVHAEQRAIMDALKKNPQKIIGSRLYFIRLDDDNVKSIAGQPYCTMCSKMALDSGVAEFVLWHKEGLDVYGTEEYNNISYEFKG